MRPRLTVSPSDYQEIQLFLENQAGIRLGPGKEYLVTSRLGSVLNEYQLEDLGALTRVLRQASNTRVMGAVVDAMTTNETFWFRDAAHFRALTHHVLVAEKTSRVRIWSAASSSGQEIYTLAIALREAMREGTLPQSLYYEILGTDISPSALAQAKSARYCGISASRGLSKDQQKLYFKQDGDCFEVLPEYRKSINFREFNLMKPFDGLGRFDVIFCRNVLIYFSQERKRDIIERFAKALNPNGVLFLGSTESMAHHGDLFEMQSLGGALLYRKR